MASAHRSSWHRAGLGSLAPPARGGVVLHSSEKTEPPARHLSGEPGLSSWSSSGVPSHGTRFLLLGPPGTVRRRLRARPDHRRSAVCKDSAKCIKDGSDLFYIKGLMSVGFASLTCFCLYINSGLFPYPAAQQNGQVLSASARS